MSIAEKELILSGCCVRSSSARYVKLLLSGAEGLKSERQERFIAQEMRDAAAPAALGETVSLGLCGRGFLDAGGLSPAEGIEIRPDVLHGLLVESLDRSIPALGRIHFQLYLTAVRFHGVRRIQVNPFVGGIVHLYQAVLD